MPRAPLGTIAAATKPTTSARGRPRRSATPRSIRITTALRSRSSTSGATRTRAASRRANFSLTPKAITSAFIAVIAFRLSGRCYARQMRALAPALSAALMSACFSEPARPHEAPSDAAPTDGSGSGSGAAPAVRKIHHAYWCNGSGSPGMTQQGYAISTSGIADGDLVLFFANIDNGTSDLWVLPSDFLPLYQVFYNGGDGQTFVAGYKIVGSAAVMTVAVTGYDRVHPFDTTAMTEGSVADNPVVLRGQLTTTRANDRLILAGGADWLTGYGSNALDGNTTFEPPSGYDLVDGIADSGGIAFKWTSQLIATRVAATPGDTGAEDAHMLATPMITGTPWTVELAIAPAP